MYSQTRIKTRIKAAGKVYKFKEWKRLLYSQTRIKAAGFSN
jgi:hypothetical protein